jgi:hypothetical protein
MIPRARAKPTARRSTLLAAIFLLVLALAATGCSMVVGFDTKVNEDGSGTVGLRVSADKELQSALGQQAGTGIAALFSGLQTQLGPGWTTKTGADPDGTQWSVAERSFKDPAELTKITSSVGGSASPFSNVSLTRSENLFSVHTFFSGTMDTGKVTSSGDLKSQIAQIPSNILTSVVKVENRLTLPGTIKSNNATEVQGSTLIWRGDGTSPAMSMKAESVSYKWGVVFAFIIIGALLIMALDVVLGLLLTKRGRQAATGTEGAVPAAAAGSTVVAHPSVEATAVGAVTAPVEPESPPAAETAPTAPPATNAFLEPMPVVPAEPASTSEPVPVAPPAANAFLGPMPIVPAEPVPTDETAAPVDDPTP